MANLNGRVNKIEADVLEAARLTHDALIVKWVDWLEDSPDPDVQVGWQHFVACSAGDEPGDAYAAFCEMVDAARDKMPRDLVEQLDASFGTLLALGVYAVDAAGQFGMGPDAPGTR